MDSKAKSHFEAAVVAQRGGQRERARRHWQAMLDIVPTHPVALNALGADALMTNDLEAATAFFGRAVLADPNSAELWSNLARAQNLSGDTGGERDSLEHGLALAPRDLALNIRLAQLLEYQADSGGAAERWTLVMAIAQDMPSLSPEGRKLVEHGRAYLAGVSARLAEQVDDALNVVRRQTPVAKRRRVDAAIDYILGRRSIYLNQCSGLHVPFLPADEFFDPALFDWFADLEAATPTIREELLATLGTDGRLPKDFAPYVDLPAGVDAATWNRLDKSTDWSAMHIWRDGVRDEATCLRFPRTAAILETLPLTHLPNRMPTIFFSALAAHTHIPAHTGVTNARAIVHLPLIVPEGCRFRVGGETRLWREGEALAFDDTIEHEAWNDSGALRVVLILDCWNPHLTETERSMIRSFYKAAENGDMAPTIAARARLG